MKSIFAAAASLPFLASVNGANVVETAQSVDYLSTLVTLVSNNNLATTLSTTEDITVFAPTDAAFTEYLGNLEAPSSECQTDILQLHVVAGKTLESGLSFPLTARNGGQIYAASQLEVNQTDELADNTPSSGPDTADDSVVHIVNKVLDGSIATTATLSGLDTLVAAVVGAGLVGNKEGVRLDDPCDTYTVFAPTEAAFSAVAGVTSYLLPAGTQGEVADPYLKGKLTELLEYHVLPTKVDSTGVGAADGTSIDALNGQQLPVANGKINGQDLVSGSLDIKAGLGIVHLIGGVLIPNGFPTANIVGVATAAGSFSTLLSLVGARPDLLSSVNTPASNSWTIFAPTDDAFTKFLAANPDPSEEAVTNILLLHIVNTAKLSGELPAELETLGGPIKVADIDLNTTDIKAVNGVIHSINTVITPAQDPPSASSTMTTSMVLACAALFGKALY